MSFVYHNIILIIDSRYDCKLSALTKHPLIHRKENITIQIVA